jgi:hypothetical protein
MRRSFYRIFGTLVSPFWSLDYVVHEYCNIQKRAIPMRLAWYLEQKRFNSSFDFDFTMSVISTSPEAREIYLNMSQHEKLISRGQEKMKSRIDP